MLETGSRVAQASLEFTSRQDDLKLLIFLPSSPKCWDYRRTPGRKRLYRKIIKKLWRYVCVGEQVSAGARGSRRKCRIAGAASAGNCEPPDVGARGWTWSDHSAVFSAPGKVLLP